MNGEPVTAETLFSGIQLEMKLRGLAKAWIQSEIHQGNPLTTGYVVVYRNEVSGWTGDLTEAKKWCPGCFAVPVENQKSMHVTVGGDDQHGAEKWEELK